MKRSNRKTAHRLAHHHHKMVILFVMMLLFASIPLVGTNPDSGTQITGFHENPAKTLKDLTSQDLLSMTFGPPFGGATSPYGAGSTLSTKIECWGYKALSLYLAWHSTNDVSYLNTLKAIANNLINSRYVDTVNNKFDGLLGGSGATNGDYVFGQDSSIAAAGLSFAYLATGNETYKTYIVKTMNAYENGIKEMKIKFGDNWECLPGGFLRNTSAVGGWSVTWGAAFYDLPGIGQSPYLAALYITYKITGNTTYLNRYQQQVDWMLAGTDALFTKGGNVSCVEYEKMHYAGHAIDGLAYTFLALEKYEVPTNETYYKKLLDATHNCFEAYMARPYPHIYTAYYDGAYFDEVYGYAFMQFLWGLSAFKMVTQTQRFDSLALDIVNYIHYYIRHTIGTGDTYFWWWIFPGATHYNATSNTFWLDRTQRDLFSRIYASTAGFLLFKSFFHSVLYPDNDPLAEFQGTISRNTTDANVFILNGTDRIVLFIYNTQSKTINVNVTVSGFWNSYSNFLIFDINNTKFETWNKLSTVQALKGYNGTAFVIMPDKNKPQSVYLDSAQVRRKKESWNATNKKLTLIANSYESSVSSNIWVYAHNLGQPTSVTVNGTSIPFAYDSTSKLVSFNVAFSSAKQIEISWIPTGGPYDLNLRIKDWDLTDNIQGAYVYKDSDVKISDGNGWANWTGVSGSVQIKVKYHGFWVSDTFSVFMDSDKTIDIQCKLYDVTVTVKPYNKQGILYLANVTAFNSTSVNGNKIKTGITAEDGKVTLTNLPNNTLTFTVYAKSDYSIVIANITQAITQDGQTLTIIAGEVPEVEFFKWSDGTQMNTIALSYNIYGDVWTIDDNATYGIKNNAAVDKTVYLWVEGCSDTSKIANLTITILDSSGVVQCVWTTADWTNIGESNAVSWLASSNIIYTMKVLIRGSSTATITDSATITLKVKT